MTAMLPRTEGGDTQQQHSGIPQDTQPTTLAADKAAAEAMGEYEMHHESAASGIAEGMQGEEGASKKLVASEEAQLDDAFNSLILLLRGRRQRADDFYATMQEFVNEYSALQQDLSSAEPHLKGSNLIKIQQMKETVKRKYANKVHEFMCVDTLRNKRRRTNLPKYAKEVMEEWFGAHRHNPYPTEEEKRCLAVSANIIEEQVSNWFVNQRKRYWKKQQQQ